MARVHKKKFQGVWLYGVEDEGGDILIPLKPISDAMGLDWSNQLQSIKSHPVLAKGMVVRTIPYGAGGDQVMVCLPLRRVNFWLGRIHPSRFDNEAVRARVILYQDKCADALYDAFHGKPVAQNSESTGSVEQDDLFLRSAEIEELKTQLADARRQITELQERLNRESPPELVAASPNPAPPPLADGATENPAPQEKPTINAAESLRARRTIWKPTAFRPPLVSPREDNFAAIAKENPEPVPNGIDRSEDDEPLPKQPHRKVIFEV
jgi:P22_AR N-terminal domain